MANATYDSQMIKWPQVQNQEPFETIKMFAVFSWHQTENGPTKPTGTTATFLGELVESVQQAGSKNVEFPWFTDQNFAQEDLPKHIKTVPPFAKECPLSSIDSDRDFASHGYAGYRSPIFQPNL